MTAQQYDDLTEELLTQPFHVIDFLPLQVPADCGGQYFAVERFYLEQPQALGIYPRFANLMLQLNCYYELAVTDGQSWARNMPPRELYQKITACGARCSREKGAKKAAEKGPQFLNFLIPSEKSLITLNSGDLYMTLYAPSEKLLELVTKLAAAQGLFVRKGMD